MAVPRLFALGLWLIATVVSTAIVWTATSTVAADVTDRPPPLVAHRDVVSELQTASPGANATTSTTRVSPTSTARPAGRTSVPSSPTVPVTAAPVATTPPTSEPSPPRTTVPVSPTTTPPPQPAVPTATYSTAGGVVTVACDGLLIRLVSATPNDGYSVVVRARGPANVEVHFVRFGQDLSVKAVCFGQPIRYYDDSPTFRSP